MEKPDPASALKFLLDQQMVSRQRTLALAGDRANRDAIIAGEQPIPPSPVEVSASGGCNLPR